MNLKQNGSLTNGHLALQYFTNRHKFTRQFAEYLNDEPPPTKILFFHGDGGNGKSLLLKFLRENCCKQFVPAIWQQLKTKSDNEFSAAIEKNELTDYTAIPSAILDFGQPSIEEDKPQDRFYGLLMLRRNLAIVASALGCKLKFPRYDFACVWYLHKKGKPLAEINKLFPPKEMELIGILVDVIAQSSLANVARAVLNTLTKHLGQAVILWKKWGLDEQWLTQLEAMELETELMETLPHWFAQDLNATMKNDDVFERIVLFFDTHEAFWGKQRHLPNQFFYQDEWLRHLLNSLELSNGIVVVMAGREPPRWIDAPDFLVPTIDAQHIGHFSSEDAKNYLQKVGISDANQQQRLITHTQAHPLFISWCADTVLVAENKHKPLSEDEFVGKITTRKLHSRLLRYVDEEIQDAIHALSACRTFDRELYFKLGDALRFQATSATFRVLTRFSFVWQDELGFRLNDLLRHLCHDEINEMTNKAHVFLEQYYREQEKVADAIYHSFFQSQERGIEEWNEVFMTADNQRNEELCRTLQKIRNELGF
jgi:hypothetical protein